VKAEYFDLGEFEYKKDVVPVEKKNVATFGQSGRVRIAKIHDSPDLFMNKIVSVCGWVKTIRSSGAHFCFVEVADGSCFKSI
jgi:hypothetical protein